MGEAMLEPWGGKKLEPTPIVRLTVLRARRVARILKLREAVVYRLCESRAFPGSYLEGKSWRIPAVDVERYQAERQAQTVRLLSAVRSM